MGPKHTREQMLAGAVDVAFDEGLSHLTFGSVAARTGVSDRTVVYYLPTKDDLITQVLLEVGGRLQVVLAAAFTGPATDHLELARQAWPVLSRTEFEPVFALYFEAIGFAAAGREPYRTLVAQLVDSWATWLTEFLTGTPTARRTEAESAITLIDGLLLLRQVSGQASSARVARRLGVTGPGRR
jgi:AcrR family transcriptional regulator